MKSAICRHLPVDFCLLLQENDSLPVASVGVHVGVHVSVTQPPVSRSFLLVEVEAPADTSVSSVFHLRQMSRRFAGVRVPLEAKGGVEGLREGGVEGVEVEPASGAEAVEGHGAGRPVRVDSHPAGAAGGGLSDAGGSVVVPGGVTLIRTEEAPPPPAPSQTALLSLPALPRPAVGHADVHPSIPLHLPVRAPSQAFCAQHLSPGGKPLGTVGTWLLLAQQRRTSVALRQQQVCGCCVWVQGKLTENWSRKYPRGKVRQPCSSLSLECSFSYLHRPGEGLSRHLPQWSVLGGGKNV